MADLLIGLNLGIVSCYVKCNVAETPFEEVISLYLGLDNENGLASLVGCRVGPIAANIGCRLISSSAILAIPEQDFIEGCEIALPEDAYQFADPHLQPRMRPSVGVKVVDRKVFARAMTRQENFRLRVHTELEKALRTVLRGRGSLEYYGSAYVNGISPLRSGDSATWLTDTPETNNFATALRESLGTMLARQFGLIITHLDLEPGADPIIERMRFLTHLPIRYSRTLVFKSGDSPIEVRVNVAATIFVIGIAVDYWTSFYMSVPRYEIGELHLNGLKEILTETLQMSARAFLQSDRTGLESRAIHTQVIERFTALLREEYGLEARLRPLSLSVSRPSSNRTSSMIVDALLHELRQLLDRRRDLNDDEDDERERLSMRIARVRRDLDNEAQQNQTDDDRQSVQVEQDLLTGEF